VLSGNDHPYCGCAPTGRNGAPSVAMENKTTVTVTNPFIWVSSVAEIGETVLRRRRGIWDACGDLLVVGGGILSLVMAALALFHDSVPVLAGLLGALATLLILSFCGVAAWFAAESAMTGEDAVRIGLDRIGGPGEMPADLGTLTTAAPFREIADTYIVASGLTEAEMETLLTLRGERFSGTLRELIETSRMLNR